MRDEPAEACEPYGPYGIEALGSDEPVTVTICADGPLLMRGPVTLRTQDGRRVEAGRRTVALCRCGRSGTKPFCDGSHKLVGFRAPATEDLG